MAKGPKRRKGKKGKRKGKKKKKAPKVLADPPPLHLLTELYKKLDEETKMLYEMRIAARRKRIECWFMAREIMNARNDNDRYRDIVEDNMMFLKRAMDKLMKLLQDERDSINKVIQGLLDEYEKRRLEYLRQAGLIEEELANIKQQLAEFEPLMNELARLMAKLEELQKEIEAAQLEANVKIRHLTNQFLNERGKLHNHLEEQLYNLIKHCRSFIMPILWNFMQNLIKENICARWTLAHTDERYIALAERREQLVRKRKLLTLEKPYWSIDWSFQKLEEMDLEKKRQRKIARDAFKLKMAQSAAISLTKKTKSLRPPAFKSTTQKGVTTTTTAGMVTLRNEPLTATTQLSKDFNTYLVQRLTAAKEAQERHAKAARREEKRFLKKILEDAKGVGSKIVIEATTTEDKEGLEGEESEAEGEDEEEEWTERVEIKPKRRRRPPGSFENEGGEDEDEDEEEDSSESEGEGEDVENDEGELGDNEGNDEEEDE